MEVRIDFTKTAQQNAEEYFAKSKKAKKKSEGAARAVKDLEAKLGEVTATSEPGKSVKRIEKKEWYEKFHWFFASNGMLAIGGNSADQNELLNEKYFMENDLFFHADIFGAGVVVLKDGLTSTKEAREEAAQFAACFSKAWPEGLSSVNVYCLKRDQVSKSSQKGYLGKGSFFLTGEREWFKGMALELRVFAKSAPNEENRDAAVQESKRARIAPELTCVRLGTKGIRIRPGKTKKSDAAKQIAKLLGSADVDAIMQLLPAGDFSIASVA